MYRFLLLTNKILDVNVDSIDEDKQGAYVSSLAESFETGKADNSTSLAAWRWKRWIILMFISVLWAICAYINVLLWSIQAEESK